jgi:hypothetical protein
MLERDVSMQLSLFRSQLLSESIICIPGGLSADCEAAIMHKPDMVCAAHDSDERSANDPKKSCFIGISS